MSDVRLNVDALLRDVMNKTTGCTNLYYQPPTGLRMKYPCIVYSEGRIQNWHANDRVYIRFIR